MSRLIRRLDQALSEGLLISIGIHSCFVILSYITICAALGIVPEFLK